MKKISTVILAFILAFALSISAFAATFTIDFGGFELFIEADTRADLAKQAFDMVNQMRVDMDLNPMVWDDSLARPAMQRAVEASISDDDYNSQQKRPNGKLWDTIASDAKAENLAYGAFATPESIVDEWMTNVEYNDNILYSDFTSVAVGCVEVSPDEFYWIQLFGDKENLNPSDYYIVTFDDGYGYGISCQMIPDGGKVMKPVDPFKSGYTIGGWFRDAAFSVPWDFNTDTVDSDMTLYVKWVFIGYDYNTDYIPEEGENSVSGSNGGSGGSSGSSRSSGGGGGGGGGGGSFSGSSLALTPSKPATSSNVGADGAIMESSMKIEAEKSLEGSNPTVKTKNASSISASTIKALAKLASKWGKALTLVADTTFNDNNAVQGRLYIPISSISAENDLKLGVYTDSANTTPIITRFEKWYSNKFVAVKLMHEGEFGGNVKVVTKVDLKKLNTNNLLIYSYNKEKNTYTQITAFSLDKKGYLHFYTNRGGDIIITDTELSKK